LRAYQFITDSKNWFMNLLMGVVCSLIPVIGDIVFNGYLFEVIDALHEDPDHVDYPDFNFNRFVTYLMRGLWPFLASLILGLILAIPIIIIVATIAVVGVILAKDTPAMMAIAVLVAVLVELTLIALAALLVMPAILHAGLARELRFGELLGFARDFFKRMWKEELLVILFMMATEFVLIIIGILLCFVGVYFTAVMINMAFHHLLFQMYEVYLKRGGSPIRRAEEAIAEVEPG